MKSFARLKKTMAYLCFISIFLFNSVSLLAQSISVSFGSSQPYGLYASKDVYNTSAGMANVGRAIGVMIEDNRKANLIHPYLQWVNNTNAVDQSALEKIYQFNYRTVQTFANWTQNMLFGGVKFNYYDESFDLFAKTGLGFGWMRTHGYNIYTDSIGVIKFNPLKVNALVLQGGLGANVYVKKNVSLCFGYDFLFAQNNFGYEQYSNANGPLVAALAVEVKPDFMVGNFYAGLKFQLSGIRKK